MTPSILIASREAPTYQGGLALYQRHLARELLERSLARPSFAAVEERRASGHEELPGPLHWLPRSGPRPLLPRLASRPLLHPVLRLAIRWAYRTMDLGPQQFECVHFIGTGWDFTGFALMEFARKSRARFTVWPAVHPNQWGDDRIDLALYHLADTIFCQSRHEIQHLVSRGLPEKKTVLCPLAPICRADGDGARLRRRHELGGRPLVLFLGRRDAGKGYPALLQAWSHVLRAHPSAVLLLAGPGGEDFIGELRALPPSSWRDLGIIDEATKADALAACDIFCLPSSAESFGLVYAEAWSYGKPVICGTAPAAREWIKPDRTGEWTDQTPLSIYRAIVRLLNSPDRRQAFGDAGRAFQRSTLTWDAVIDVHRKVFDL